MIIGEFLDIYIIIIIYWVKILDIYKLFIGCGISILVYIIYYYLLLKRIVNIYIYI
jgi:hypothetical protein